MYRFTFRFYNMLEVFATHIIPEDQFVQKKHDWLKHIGTLGRQKVSLLRNLKDQQRTLLAEIQLRAILKRHYHYNNRDIILFANSKNKPYLINIPLFFNISHSGNWVCCAISDRIVGTDIERIRKIKTDIAGRFFSHHENNKLNQLKGDEKLHYFFDLWTIKESYLKLIGKGLSHPLNSFSVELQPDGKHSIKNATGINLDLEVLTFNGIDGYKLAVIGRTKEINREIRIHPAAYYYESLRD